MSLAENTIATPYIHIAVKRRKNTWYSIKDGNWNDRSIWMSNEQRRYDYPGQNIPAPVFPQVGDDVYINHAVTLNIGSSASPIIINNIYIAGTFKADNSSRVITINGDMQAVGAVDFTSSNVIVRLYGINNYITTFTAGSSLIVYGRNGDQPIMSLSYNNLSVWGFGTKTFQGNISCAGNIFMQANDASGNLITTGSPVSIIEIAGYTLTVTGTTTIQGACSISDVGAGNLLFTGLLNLSQFASTLSFTGNPAIEFRGGLTSNASITAPNFGTGAISFTTNNQSVTISISPVKMSNVITVIGAITVTNANGSSYWEIDTSIDGTVSGSGLINKGSLYFGSTTLPMATHGTWDYTTFSTNTVGFVMSSAFTVPYTSFTGGLIVGGTGAKTLTGATSIGGNFTISSLNGSTTFDPVANNLTVTGTVTVTGSTFNCTGAATLKFGTLSQLAVQRLIFQQVILLLN